MTRVYIILASLAGFIASLFAVFTAGGRSARNKVLAQQAEDARQYQQAGIEAMTGGLENEQKVNNETIDTDNRDHFQ